MNKGSSFAKSSREDTQKSEKKCKAFKDISKYFSKQEWAKLGYSDKITYVYMKRNYDTMTGLGLRATLPAFMCPKKRAIKSKRHDSDENENHRNQNEPLQEVSNVKKRKHQKVMLKTVKEEEDSDPIPITPGFEQAQKVLCLPGKACTSDQQSEIIPGPKRGKNSIWAYRLRERKNLVVYEEISDPEEED
ncbi:putative protein SSX6 [Vulpes vulpes]|uniref:KRAB-related domain-containing protein n=1 Tax=Vulpes vulpes TaxID=9627 RepID=A0A3Q7QVU5_VULVU|nr:putative protein SSX6 [Vulpes vulpes]